MGRRARFQFPAYYTYLSIDHLEMEKPKQVLVILPSLQSQTILEEYSQGRYEYHWFTDPNAPVLEGTNNPKVTKTFEPLKFVDRAVRYVKEHSIDAILYFHDFSGFLGSIICEKTGLPGPSIESTFLCIHKYYSRKAEPSNLWFEAIELEKNNWQGCMKYPCYVKAPCLFLSMSLFVVQNEKEMELALASCKRELPAWNALWKPLFEQYVDSQKYPLALKDTVIAEELVPDGTQHTVEGWVDDIGNFQVWMTSDEGYFMKPQKTLEGYFMPSQAPDPYIEQMEYVALSVARNHGLCSTFFNVEVWCRSGGKQITVTEINNRISFSYHHLYSKVYHTSNFHAALHLACGEYQKVCELSPNKMQKNPLVGGLFFVQIHINRKHKASEVINFEAAKDLELQIPHDTAPYLFASHGPGIDLSVDESTLLQPLGTCGILVTTFNVFKPTFGEVLQIGEDVRNKLLKKKEVLPHEREVEYYNQCCGLSCS